LDQERGFTERSLNILLKKICDHESKEEAIALGYIPSTDSEIIYPVKEPAPLIKTMYIRDLNKSQIFNTEMFDHNAMENNPDLCDTVMRAYGDINYDEKLENKSEFDERIN